MTAKQRSNGPLYDVLALVLLLVAAAVLQQSCGPWLWGLAKPPFLLSLAAYYALLRPLPLAVPAVSAAGILADGLGSVPFPATLAAALALLAFCAFRGRKVLVRTPRSCALLGAAAVLAALLLQALALRLAGSLHDSALELLLRSVCQTLLAVPVAYASAWAAWGFERATGNIPPERKGAPAHART